MKNKSKGGAPAKNKNARGKGPVQTGKREKVTWYQVGAARFHATPERDVTGDKFKTRLGQEDISHAEFIRRLMRCSESVWRAIINSQ